MKPEQSPLYQSINTKSLHTGGVNKLPIILTLLTVLMSVSMAVVTNKFGPLALLVIPGVIYLIGGLSKPDLVLAVYFFITFTQFSDTAIEFYGLPSLAQPLAGLMVLIILVRMTLYDEHPVQWARSIFVLLSYILILFVPMLYADDNTASYTTFINFAKDIIGGVIVVILIQRPSSLRNAVWPIIIAGIVMGTISVIQSTTGDFTNQYGGFGRWQQAVSGEVISNRVSGPYINPNAYAQVMVVIMAISLSRFLHEKNIGLRLIAGWSSLVCIAAIIFTYSRGGFLTLIATLGILFVQNRSRVFPIFLTFVIGASLLQFLPSDYGGRVATLFEIGGSQGSQINDPSFRGRMSENLAAWRMFSDNPYFGVGLGHYKIQYQDYSRQIGLDPRRVGRTPASLYMELLAEQGLVGTSVFALLIYLVFSGLVRARIQFARLGMHDNAHIAMSLIAALVGYLVQATVKNSAYSNVFWLLIGMAISTEQVAYTALHKSKESSKALE